MSDCRYRALNGHRQVVRVWGFHAGAGGHDQLLAANGLYARLWQRQSGGFLDPDLVGSHQAAVRAFPLQSAHSRMSAHRDVAHQGNLMNPTFEKIITHDDSDDCPVCRAQDIVSFSLVPAVAAWEEAYQMPRYSLTLHGAASLMALMIQNGVAREDIEEAVTHILDDYEMQMAEEGLLGGPQTH